MSNTCLKTIVLCDRKKTTRFVIPPERFKGLSIRLIKFQGCTLRFLAPQIAEVIFLKYFEGNKSRGRRDKNFLQNITGPFLCLTAAVIYHLLRSWRKGVYSKPGDFKMTNGGVQSK